MSVKCQFTTGHCETAAEYVWQGRTLCPQHFPHHGDTAAASSARAVFEHRHGAPRATVGEHLTAAVKDYVLATGTAAWDPRHYAVVAKGTRALTVLFEAAEIRGPVVAEAVVRGYFKISANEPHRLPALVDSILMLRLDAVARALLAYDRNND